VLEKNALMYFQKSKAKVIAGIKVINMFITKRFEVLLVQLVEATTHNLARYSQQPTKIASS
jgi:hypothetical protein